MRRRITASYARTHMYALVRNLAPGEEIEITKRGRVVGILEWYRNPKEEEGIEAVRPNLTKRRAGTTKGSDR